MKKVYLAGAMEFAHDGGIGWRKELTNWLATHLNHSVLDPTILEHDQITEAERVAIPELKKGNLDKIRPLSQRIIDYDLDLVENHCDYVVCLWNESTQMGCGSAGEITFAFYLGKPVHLLLDYPTEKVSTWMIGCTTTIHNDWDSLKKELKVRYGGKIN